MSLKAATKYVTAIPGWAYSQVTTWWSGSSEEAPVTPSILIDDEEFVPIADVEDPTQIVIESTEDTEEHPLTNEESMIRYCQLMQLWAIQEVIKMGNTRLASQLQALQTAS